MSGTIPKPGGHTAGTWLKASAPARLRLVPSGDSSASLELSLPKRLLVRADLGDSCCGLRLLRDQCILIIPKGAVVHAFKFFDRQESTSFEHCVQGLQAAALTLKQQREQQLLQVAPARGAAAQGAGGGRSPKDTRGAVPGSLQEEVGGDGEAGMVAGAPIPAAREYAPSDAQVKAAIQDYLCDPSFHAYVHRVELLWDQVQEEIAEQQLRGSAATGPGLH